jgi:hypothetical protein
VSAVTPRLATLVTLARWARARRGVVTVAVTAVTAVTRLARHARTVGMGSSRRRDRHRDLQVRAGRDRRDSPLYSRSDGGLGPTAGAVILYSMINIMINVMCNMTSYTISVKNYLRHLIY